MRKQKIIVFFICVLLTITTSLITGGKLISDKNDTNTGIGIKGNLGPFLSFDPTSYYCRDLFIGEVDITTFEIWNSGCCSLVYDLYEECNWVDVNPAAGSSTGEHDTITIEIDTSSLSDGLHRCDIQINSNSGEGVFSVYINVLTATTPKLTFSPRIYDFGDMLEGEMDTTSFDIWNCGIDTITYSLSGTSDWIDISPLSGSSTGEHDTITVILNTSNLTTGHHLFDIQITSNDGNNVFNVRVNIVAANSPVLSIFPKSHDFGYMLEGTCSSITFEIWNLGKGYLTYTLTKNCDWIDITPKSGLSTGEHDIITIKVNTTNLQSGPYWDKISIVSNGGSELFSVSLEISEGYTDLTVEEAWNLLSDTNNGIQIPIDVRYDHEWTEEHIDTPAPEDPKHHCLCEWSDETYLQEFMSLYQGEEIIVYCKSGGRSATAANALVENDFDGTIYNMLGGITEWKNAGYPIKSNQAPELPTITGPEIGKPGEQYEYTIVTTDIEGNDVYYYINWGDNQEEIRIGPYASDEIVTLSHIYAEKGTYNLRVKATDIYEADSDWSTHETTMTRFPFIYTFIQWLLQLFGFGS